MKNNIIKVLIVFIVILIIIVVALGFTSHTVICNGTMIENGIKNNISITISYRRIDKIFNNMHGYIHVEKKSDIFIKGDLYSSINKHIDNRILSTSTVLYYKNESIQEFATLYFDKNFENIVLLAHGNAEIQRSYKEFYSANDSFRALAKKIDSPTNDD